MNETKDQQAKFSANTVSNRVQHSVRRSCWRHDWKQEYFGIRCQVCGLFFADNDNYFGCEK